MRTGRAPSSFRTPEDWPRGDLVSMEARVRALTREVGTLKEDLRRETKRRERASERCSECEAGREAAEQQVKELRYSNARLAEELASTQASAKKAAEDNSQAIASMKGELSRMESESQQREAHTQDSMQSVFQVVQELQRVLFTPGNVHEASSGAVQRSFTSLLQHLSLMSSKLASFSGGGAPPAALVTALPTPQAPVAFGSGVGAGIPEALDLLREQNDALRAQVADLQARAAASAFLKSENDSLRDQLSRLQLQRPPPSPQQQHGYQLVEAPETNPPVLAAALSQVESLIPHYRQALSKLKLQAAALQTRLEEEFSAKRAHAEELGALRGALRERDEELRRVAHRQKEAAAALQQREADIAAVSSEAETSGMQLQRELQGARERCRELEEAYGGACHEYEDTVKRLRAQCEEELRRQEEQQAQIDSLQRLLREQQSDISTALDLVLARQPPPQGLPPATSAAAPSSSGSRRRGGGGAAASTPLHGSPQPSSYAPWSKQCDSPASSAARKLAQHISHRIRVQQPPGLQNGPSGSPAPHGGSFASGPAVPGSWGVSSRDPVRPGEHFPYPSTATAAAAAAGGNSLGGRLPLDVSHLQREMAALDGEISDLEASLKDAAERFS